MKWLYIKLTLLTSFFFNESSYNILAASQNNFMTLNPLLADVSINKSILLSVLILSPCSKLITFLYSNKNKINKNTYFSSSTSFLLPIKKNLVSGLHKLLHCLIHSSIELKDFLLSTA